MATVKTRAFRSGNSEAVRIPREMAFGEGVELALERCGDLLTIRPIRPSIGEVVQRLRVMPRPRHVEVRDTEIIPEPRGL